MCCPNSDTTSFDCCREISMPISPIASTARGLRPFGSSPALMASNRSPAARRKISLCHLAPGRIARAQKQHVPDPAENKQLTIRFSEKPREGCDHKAGIKGGNVLAEREGFEPPVPVKARTLSRRLVSTTHPSLRVVDAPAIFLILSARRIFTSRPGSSLDAAGILPLSAKYLIGDLIHHGKDFRPQGSGVKVERGSRISVAKLGLHIGRMSVAFSMGRKAAAQDLEAGIERHPDLLGDGIETQTGPVVCKHGFRTQILRAILLLSYASAALENCISSRVPLFWIVEPG